MDETHFGSSAQLPCNLCEFICIVRFKWRISSVFHRLSTAFRALDLSLVSLVNALPLLLSCEFSYLIKLMWLLRHNKNTLIDVEEVVFDLLSRAFVSVSISI